VTAATDTGQPAEDVDLADVIDSAVVLAGDIRRTAMMLGPKPPPGRPWPLPALGGMTAAEWDRVQIRVADLQGDIRCLGRDVEALASRLDAAELAKEKAGELEA
jgi:hypothetical protein